MDKIAYFGHHKCASTYISAVMLNVSRLLGLRVHSEFLSSRLPLGYEKYTDQVNRIESAYHTLETGRYDILCHGNADNAVVIALGNRGSFRGFHVIRDPRDMGCYLTKPTFG